MAAFTPEPFAAALGVSTLTGLQLLADALDLNHRLPRIWAAVEALAVAPWKARKIAQATHHLSQAAAASVDAQLADRIGSCGWRAIETAVAQAIATHDPHLLETREKHGKDAWGVRLFHRGVGTDGGDDWAGTSHLEVTGDTLDLTVFHDLVCEQAAQLKALGDTDTLDVRKAKAVGVIANRQATLDLGTLLDGSPGAEHAATIEPVESVGGRSLAKTKLYLHLSLTDLLRLDDSEGGTGFGTVERFGPASIARIKDWAGRSRVTIQPVLDMSRDDAVDAHDPPAWMRELVILRDRHCVFPWCTRDARACDLDHITPYEENGPPGQTRPDALAALCRRHHRAKTFRRWRYHRTPPAATNGPDPKARPTSSPRPAPCRSRPIRHARSERARSPGHQPGDPACPRGAAGPGRRGVPRRRSVQATRGGTPQKRPRRARRR